MTQKIIQRGLLSCGLNGINISSAHGKFFNISKPITVTRHTLYLVNPLKSMYITYLYNLLHSQVGSQGPLSLSLVLLAISKMTAERLACSLHKSTEIEC